MNYQALAGAIARADRRDDAGDPARADRRPRGRRPSPRSPSARRGRTGCGPARGNASTSRWPTSSRRGSGRARATRSRARRAGARFDRLRRVPVRRRRLAHARRHRRGPLLGGGVRRRSAIAELRRPRVTSNGSTGSRSARPRSWRACAGLPRDTAVERLAAAGRAGRARAHTRGDGGARALPRAGRDRGRRRGRAAGVLPCRVRVAPGTPARARAPSPTPIATRGPQPSNDDHGGTDDPTTVERSTRSTSSSVTWTRRSRSIAGSVSTSPTTRAEWDAHHRSADLGRRPRLRSRQRRVRRGSGTKDGADATAPAASSSFKVERREDVDEIYNDHDRARATRCSRRRTTRSGVPGSPCSRIPTATPVGVMSPADPGAAGRRRNRPT